MMSNKYSIYKKEYYAARRGKKFNRKAWSKSELKLLLNLQLSDFQIYALTGRSVQGIQVKRSKLRAIGLKIPNKADLWNKKYGE